MVELSLTIPSPTPTTVEVSIPGADSLSGARATRLGASVPFSGNVQPASQVIAQATDWQDDSSAAGWKIPLANSSAVHAGILVGDIPPHALDTGGGFRVFATGRITPASTNAQLYFHVSVDGVELSTNTIIRDDLTGTDITATGWGFSNATLGLDVLKTWFPGETRWWFELDVQSLGVNCAAVHPHKSPTTSQLRFRGKVYLGEMINGYGLHVFGQNPSFGGDWATGTSYTSTPSPAMRVELHGRHYICIANHTAAAANKPGEGSTWRTYWRTSFIEYAIFNEMDLDLAAEDGHQVLLSIGGPFADSTGDDEVIVDSAQISSLSDSGGYAWHQV